MKKKPETIAELTVVCGSMFAGKTEELIRQARRALYAKKIVQVFKPQIDSRFDASMVVTHMGVAHEAIPVGSTKELASLLNPDVEVVLIEEVQFFSSDIVVLVQGLVDQGVNVVCAGLDQDFRRKPFGPMPALLALADVVIKLRAICMNCGALASHTYRVIDGRPAHWNDPTILIGANESYEARCHKCFKLLGIPKSEQPTLSLNTKK